MPLYQDAALELEERSKAPKKGKLELRFSFEHARSYVTYGGLVHGHCFYVAVEG